MIMTKEEIFRLVQEAKAIPAGSDDFFSLSEEQMVFFTELVIDHMFDYLNTVVRQECIE